MKALRRFEAWFNQLLEGGLAGRLGARIQPVDLARRLADHMEDHRTVGAGRLYVPNNFRVYLAPATLAGFATFKGGLEEELSAFLGARAREAGYHFVGRVRVLLLADAELRAERLRIESDLVDRRGVVLGEGGQATAAIDVQAAPAPPGPPALALVIGERRVPLVDRREVKVGRALDNQVILEDTTVSRHHARLVPRGDHWMVEDLGSTHGCFVNSHRVTTSLLRPGDRLQLGSVVAHVTNEDGEGHVASVDHGPHVAVGDGAHGTSTDQGGRVTNPDGEAAREPD